MLDNVGLRYPHRASWAKAPRTLRQLPLLRFAVSATGGAHLCSIQYYLRFWLGICRTSLAVSALRTMRYCLWNPQRIPAALCLESCLCLWNIRHFLCFQVHLKCKLINWGKHEPAFGFPVPSRSKTSKRPALLHGKIKKIGEGRFPQLSHKIISSIKLRLPFPPWPAPSAALLGKCSCSARRSPHRANSRQGASSARR